MNKKAIKLMIELLVAKYDALWEAMLNDGKPSHPHDLVMAKLEPIMDLEAAKKAINFDKYDQILFAVRDTPKRNKKIKKKLKHLRHILEKD